MARKNEAVEQIATTGLPTSLLRLSWLRSDKRVQRFIDQNLVRKIADSYDPNQLKALTVNKRQDGTYSVVDGQHRVEALRRLFCGEETLVPCIIVEVGDWQEERRLMEQLNRWKNPIRRCSDIWRAVFAEEEPWCSILRAIEARGFTFQKEGTPSGAKKDYRELNCFAALESLHRTNPVLLAFVLAVIGRCWQGRVDSTREMTVGGLARFLSLYGPQLEKSVRDQQLFKFFQSIEPSEVIDKAGELPAKMNASVRVSRALLEMWNRRNARRRLSVVAEDSAGASIV